jgi:hypothetical protein
METVLTTAISITCHDTITRGTFVQSTAASFALSISSVSDPDPDPGSFLNPEPEPVYC